MKPDEITAIALAIVRPALVTSRSRRSRRLSMTR